jgi:Secretion system C-terminal sorting domain
MRAILFMFILLFASSMAFGEEILYESFEIDELPEGWMIEGPTPEQSWVIANGAARINGGQGGDYATILSTPEMNLTGYTNVMLTIIQSYVFPVGGNPTNHGTIVASWPGGGDGVNVAWYQAESNNGDMQYQLPNQVWGELLTLNFTFQSGEMQESFWRIFDVLVTGDPMVDVNLYSETTTIPAMGGTVSYDLEFISTLPDFGIRCRYWTRLIFPTGQEDAPLYERCFVLEPFMDMTVTGLTQVITANHPPGTYRFQGMVETLEGTHYLRSDEFEFFKQGVVVDEDNEFAPEEIYWTMGDDSNPAESSMLPTHYSISNAYPNPFNPTTRLTISMPEMADLQVAAYNALGHQVAKLADGAHEAGNHTFTLNGSNLAGGIYFVRASAAGWSDVQKVVLMK